MSKRVTMMIDNNLDKNKNDSGKNDSNYNWFSQLLKND